MRPALLTRNLIKGIAVITAAAFLWNQLVWAGDLITPITGAPTDGQPPGSSLADFEAGQAAKVSLIGRKQIIEDFEAKEAKKIPLPLPAGPPGPYSHIVLNIDLKSRLFEIREYYKTDPHFLEKRKRNIADSEGFIAYEYKDEDWNNTGLGRITAARRKTANDSGIMVYEYEYHPGRDDISRKVGYSDPERQIAVTAFEYDTEGAITVVEDYYASGRLHTKVDSDCTIYEYFDEDSGGNNRARLIKETATGGNYKVYEDYYVNTGQVRYVKEYSVSDELLNITEYDIDGTVIIPYDYIDDKYAVKREDNGSIATFLIDETGEARINTFRDGSGNIFEIYNWDTNWELTGTEKHFQDGSIEIYTPVSREDPFLRLTEKKIPDPDFIKGVNLPWINYGYDLGKESSTDYWIGYSSDPGTLYEKFDARKNDYVRVFLFADLRSGMNFSGDGTPIGFTEKVLEDMRKLLDAAKMFNIKLMPVLFDYGIADGVTHEGLFEVGEHPELITDPVKKEALLSIFGDFFDEFAADPNIYAWDIINEPEYSQAVSIQDMQSFVTDFVQMIHSRSPAATVTVGSKNRQSLVDNWTNAGLDLYQYHYYDDFEGTLPLDYHVYNLGLDKPVIAGELDPALATHKLDTLNENGCSGGFFWEDGDGYIIDDPAYAEISDWFKGISITYDYYASGRKYTETYNDGTVKEFEDRAAYPDGNGKLIKETYNTGAYKNHSYYNGATIVEKIDFFLSGGILFMRENYDVSGGLVSTALYHDNGQLKEIRRTNGTWEKYDENGTFIQSGEKTGAIEVEYNASGNIERLIEGAYIEERQYVTAGGIIEYTLAVNDGSVKAIRGGLYSGIDMISKENSSAADSAVRVTYDGGISVSYIDGAISSLAAENGYINFYNGDDVQRQNSANGSLYYFEDNFLKEVATTDGVIYNFDKEISASGITISLTSAIINDIVYNFTGSILSTITDGTNSTTVTELLLRNNLEIESLKVDRGSGEETIPGGDMLFKRIETLFETINTDVPNIKFIYSPDRDIREILTSEYTHLEFQNELISKTTSTEGVEVEYEFITENDEITGLRMTESGAMRTFNKSGELLSIELIDGDDITAVTFTGGILEDMEQAGAALRDISLDAAGNIEGARLFTTRGEKFFFAGGSLRDFIDSQNCEYAVDKGGEIIELTKIDTGEVFDVTYSTDPGSNSELITFTSQTSGTKYVYDDEMLKSVIDPSGMEVDYEYYTDERAKRVQISYGGKVSSAYNYDYADEETIITNEIGASRHYGADNRLARIVTAYGETYLYAYETDDAGDPLTFINYTYKELSDGTLIEYHKGRVEKVTKPDNSWIDNIEFDTVTQELFKFSMHTADGNHRNIIIQGNFVQFEMEDSTRLIFYDGKLVAFGNSQGIVPIYDLDELEDIIYIRDPADHSEVPLENIDIAASNWRHQTYEDSQAIRFVERDFSDNYWELNIDLRTGDPRYSEGEMYLDLRYDIPGLAWQAPIDMRGKEISFLIQLDESFEYDPLYPCKFQVFAKDKNWHTQYGAAVRVNSRSSWMEVSLLPAEDTINMGYTDPGFDPSNISMIGLRMIQPDNVPHGLNYLGKVLVKENILPDLFENVNYDPNPLDDLYYGLGIDRNLDTLTGGDPLEQETILENFVTSFGNGPSGLYQESLLNQINWHTETEDSALQAIESVYRDAATDDIVLTINLNTSSSTNSKGELYFDVRNDVPGLGWGEPMNLTSRPLSMLIEVPRGMIGASDKPNGARLFVEDENGNTQYGTWINLKEANKLYQMDLTPTFGDIPMGYTDPGFDPSKIIRMGVNISTQPGSNTNFQGQARLKFLPASGTGDTDDIVNMPLWMDLRGIKEYLLDDDDNYIRVPGVTYLAEEYFSYVFNNGSGREPTANFASLAAPNTRWKYYGSGSWETDTYNKGMTSIGWDASTETLKGALNMNSSTRQGEIYLDTRYSCYVPGKNWQDATTVDMTGQELVFYVRASDGFRSNTTAPLTLEVFSKDSAWKTEYSRTVALDTAGEWARVEIVPSPTDFNNGYADAGFDPRDVSMFGLRVRSNSSSYTYSGNFEIKYAVNAVDLGTSGLGDTGILPANPVWVDQRSLVQYMQSNNIALYGDYTIMEDATQLIAEIPDFRLPGDFASFLAYDKDNDIRYITKPDGTTSWFDGNDQIDFITFGNGDIFVDYDYTDEGKLADATLARARNELTDSMANIRYKIEQETLDTLLIFAEQNDLQIEDFMEEVNTQRSIFANERNRLQAMRYKEVKRKVLWWVEYETVEVPGVAEAIAEVNRQEALFNQRISDELARVYNDIQAKKDEIDAEKLTILEEYAQQERKMLYNIIREETVPLIYYYYRTIIGREATGAEIDTILRQKFDTKGYYESAALYADDINDIKGVITSLKMDTLHPVYARLSDEAKTIVDNFNGAEAVLDSQALIIRNAINNVLLDHGLYNEIVSYYGGTAGLNSRLSEETVAYISNLECLDKLDSKPGYTGSKNVKWLNRYLVQDIFSGINIEYRTVSPWNDVNFSGIFNDEIIDAGLLIAELSQDKTGPIYTNLAQRAVDVIDAYSPGDELTSSETGNIAYGLEKVILTYDLYSQLASHYGTETSLHADLSVDTILYISGLTCLDIPLAELTEKNRVDLAWLNRYILQDLLSSLAQKDKGEDEECFSAGRLEQTLSSSSARASAVAFKTLVTNEVIAFMTNYLYTPTQRDTMLTGLDLTPDDMINITDTFIQAVRDWLNGQGLHFAQSAFGTLKKYLVENGITVTMEEIAKKCLLSDILSGISGPMSDEAIEISMYTMNKVAGMYGLSGISCRLTYGDIQNINGPFVTLVNKGHYVTVLDAAEDNVTYWDDNLGEDGGEVTISRRDFESNWQGDAITDTGSFSSLRSLREAEGDEAIYVLTDREAQNIKGAFFWFLIPIFTTIFTAISTVVSVAISVITAVLGPLLTFVGNIALGLVQAIANIGSMLIFAGKSFLGALGIGAATSAGAGAAATGFSLSTLISGVGTTLMKVGVGYGVSLGLDAMGVDPVVSGMISSIVTGGVTGLIEGGITQMFQTALQYGATTGMGLLGQHFDLDPVITGILSMSTATLTGAAIDPNVSFGNALETVIHDVAWELGAYGIQYAGMQLGLDPNVSYLAGIGIRSSLQAGLSGFGAGGLPLQDMWNAAVDQLTNPVNLALAFNVAGDAIGLDPMINNMMITAVMGAIDGFNENPENRIIGMFKGMFDNFWNASVRALTFNTYDPIEGGWNKSIQKDYTLMNLTNFINVVIEYGIEAAIENHLTNIFRDEAVRVINQRGGIADFLTGDAEMVQEGDFWLKKINVTDDDKLYLDPNTDDIIGRDYGDIKERGKYGTNPYTGGFGLIDGTLEDTTENGTRMVYHVTGSQVIDKMEVYGTDGGYIEIIARDPETGLQLNEDGIPLGGIVADFDKGKLYEYEYLGDSVDFELNFDNPKMDIQSAVDVDWSSLTDDQKKDIVNYYMVMNGIGNQNPYNSPNYMFNFKTDLAHADPLTGDNGVALIPLYNDMVPTLTTDDLAKVVGNEAPYLYSELRDYGAYLEEDAYGVAHLTEAFYALTSANDLILSPQFGDKKTEIYNFLQNLNRSFFDDNVNDVGKNVYDWFKVQDVANKIYQNMERQYGQSFPADLTGLCYSGSGDPFIHLLNTKPEIDTSSIVLVGTPIKEDRQILNTNVETVVTLYGENDWIFKGSNSGLRLGTNFQKYRLFENNPVPVTEFEIEILGIGHRDYFYDPNNPGDSPEVKQKASRFIAEVTKFSKDKSDLERFLLNNLGITRDLNGKYTVDLDKVVY